MDVFPPKQGTTEQVASWKQGGRVTQGFAKQEAAPTGVSLEPSSQGHPRELEARLVMSPPAHGSWRTHPGSSFLCLSVLPPRPPSPQGLPMPRRDVSKQMSEVHLQAGRWRAGWRLPLAPHSELHQPWRPSRGGPQQDRAGSLQAPRREEQFCRRGPGEGRMGEMSEPGGRQKQGLLYLSTDPDTRKRDL